MAVESSYDRLIEERFQNAYQGVFAAVIHLRGAEDGLAAVRHRMKRDDPALALLSIIETMTHNTAQQAIAVRRALDFYAGQTTETSDTPSVAPRAS